MRRQVTPVQARYHVAMLLLGSPTARLSLSVVLASACATAPTSEKPASAPVRAGPAVAATTAPSPASGSPSTAELSAIAERMRSSRHCKDTCCTGEIPPAYQRAWPGSPDAAAAPALRAILDAPASPAVHAVAALWLSRALDVDDIPRLARCMDATEPAGVFPTVMVGQAAQRCYPVGWSEQTLGRVCVDAIGRITAREFASASEARAWMSTHPSPLDSFEYWQKVVGVSRPAPNELLARLLRHSPELYFRVAALEPDVLDRASWATFERVAREQIGGDRIIALLKKQQGWPELAPPDQFARFASTVLSHAREIFNSTHAPALLELWQGRGCCTEDWVRAELAVAVSRLEPDQGRQVLLDTLAELQHSQAAVLEELARSHATEESATLERWFYGDAAKRAGNQDELATAIVRGLEGRANLRLVLKKKTPSAEARELVEQVIAKAASAGFPAPETCRGYLGPRAGKGSSAEAWKNASREATALRAKCLKGALQWIRQP
ncbi:MAG: hypothetical protein U0263_40890 [Polyangiaceae bacterium]